jgi:hypothetical protein
MQESASQYMDEILDSKDSLIDNTFENSDNSKGNSIPMSSENESNGNCSLSTNGSEEKITNTTSKETVHFKYSEEKHTSHEHSKCILGDINPTTNPILLSSCTPSQAPPISVNVDIEVPQPKRIGTLSAEERRRKIEKYLEKKKRRNFKKKIMYQGKRNFALNKVRLQGKFLNPKKASLIIPSDIQKCEALQSLIKANRNLSITLISGPKRFDNIQNLNITKGSSNVNKDYTFMDFPFVEKKIFEFTKVKRGSNIKFAE